MKTYILALISFCLLAFTNNLLAQEPTKELPIPQQNEKGLWGYKHEYKKHFKIKPQFTSARPFANLFQQTEDQRNAATLAIVSVRSKDSYKDLYGIIDTKGKFVAEPIFSEISDFFSIRPAIYEPNHVAKVAVTAPNGYERLHGVITINGEYVVEPIFSSLRFIEGYEQAIVAFIDNQGKDLYGIISIGAGKGEWKHLEIPQYASIEKVKNSYNDEYYLLTDHNNRKGIRAIHGDLTIPCQYERITLFGEFMVGYKDGAYKIFCLSSRDEINDARKWDKTIPTYDSLYVITNKECVPFGKGEPQQSAPKDKPFILAKHRTQEAKNVYSLINYSGYIKLDSISRFEKLDAFPNTYLITDKDGNAQLYGISSKDDKIWKILGDNLGVTSIESIKRLKGTDYLINGNLVVNLKNNRLLIKSDVFYHRDEYYLFCSDGSGLIDKALTSDGEGKCFQPYRFYDVHSSDIPIFEFSFDFILNSLKANCPNLSKEYEKRMRIPNSVPLKFQFGNSDIEVREYDGNIYTYPVLYQGTDNSCLFYVKERHLRGESNVYWNDQCFIRINGRSKRVTDVFPPHIYNPQGDLKQLMPVHCHINDDGNYLITFVAFYSSKHNTHSELFVSLVEPNSLRELRHITLDISPSTYYSLRFLFYGQNMYICHLSDKYKGCYDRIGAVNTNLTSACELRVFDGEYITDIYECDNMVYLCGSTTKRGYIDYDNPLLKEADISNLYSIDLDPPTDDPTRYAIVVPAVRDITPDIHNEKGTFIENIYLKQGDNMILKYSDDSFERVAIKKAMEE